MDTPQPTPGAVLFTADAIRRRVDLLAAEIVARMGERFVAVGLLKGTFVFLADLVRALDRAGARPGVEFLRLSSYGLGQVSAGEVHLIGDIPTDIGGRRILLVDDIVDTGRSMAYAATLIRQRGVDDLRLCALLDKPARREVPVTVDFIGFTVPDVFVAGYGIDYAESFRHRPDIVAVK